MTSLPSPHNEPSKKPLNLDSLEIKTPSQVDNLWNMLLGAYNRKNTSDTDKHKIAHDMITLLENNLLAVGDPRRVTALQIGMEEGVYETDSDDAVQLYQRILAALADSDSANPTIYREQQTVLRNLAFSYDLQGKINDRIQVAFYALEIEFEQYRQSPTSPYQHFGLLSEVMRFTQSCFSDLAFEQIVSVQCSFQDSPLKQKFPDKLSANYLNVLMHSATEFFLEAAISLKLSDWSSAQAALLNFDKAIEIAGTFLKTLDKDNKGKFVKTLEDDLLEKRLAGKIFLSGAFAHQSKIELALEALENVVQNGYVLGPLNQRDFHTALYKLVDVSTNGEPDYQQLRQIFVMGDEFFHLSQR